MLNQILSHTPVYVWAILAFLVVRGVAAARTRETSMRKLFIIPAVMLALALEDIGRKFGAGVPAWAAWAVAAGATMLVTYRFGRPRLAAGAAPGRVRLHGSWAPLAMMMAVFCTKYGVSVALAVQPALGRDTTFAMLACALFGLSSGWFLGRLAGDVAAWRRLQGHAVGTARMA
ncbi:DUF6622 family protein [uncultured Massilia sp.]|uniref:DUF6622 family protein n=1 Tax=uncultured Massilia sp. TaxID=169973 RepID=UPI0025D8B317|nr:DUF6622 family protein [uncultured Massilia sp.]